MNAFDLEMQEHFDRIQQEWIQQIVADRTVEHISQFSELMRAWLALVGLREASEQIGEEA